MITAEIKVTGNTLDDIFVAIESAKIEIVNKRYLAGGDTSDRNSYSYDVVDTAEAAA